MSRAVFVDASAWIAIINKKHRHHQQAVEVYRRLLLEGTPLFTTTWTIYEALTLIKARVGYEAATKLWEAANNRRVVSMAKVGPKVEENIGRFEFIRLKCKLGWYGVLCVLFGNPALNLLILRHGVLSRIMYITMQSSFNVPLSAGWFRFVRVRGNQDGFSCRLP